MEPTMGRIVYFTPDAPNDVSAVESPAIVSRVNADDTLDLTVFPPGDVPYSATNVPRSESGKSELGRWGWPPAAPTGSAPETDEPADPAPPETETPVDPEPPAPEGDDSETPTTSAASEKPLYKIGGDEVPDGFTASGLETPEGAVLYHYAGDTAGQAHTFDVGTDDAIVLYAEADDNEQPVQPATEASATS